MILFCHKADYAGGVQSLIINLSRELTFQGNSVALIDSENGFIHQSFQRMQIPHHFIPFSDLKKYTNKFSEDDIYVSFGNLDIDVDIIRHLKVRFFYWQVHPDYFRLVFRIRTRLLAKKFHTNNPLTAYLRNRLVGQMIKSDSMAVMSESHLKFSRKNEIHSLQKSILPIPITGFPDNLPARNIERLENKRVNIVYIGRPQEWKIVPFMVILRDLNKIPTAQQEQITLTVITTNEQPFRNKIDNCGYVNQIAVQFRTGLSDHSLSEFLTKEADIVFSMGTSLLESGKLGIPTAFADACLDGYFPAEYQYRWLFETRGYNLGNPLRKPSDHLPGRTLSEMISQGADPGNTTEIGNACYNYVLANHFVSRITEKFISLTGHSGLRTTALKWIIPFFGFKEFLRRLTGK